LVSLRASGRLIAMTSFVRVAPALAAVLLVACGGGGGGGSSPPPSSSSGSSSSGSSSSSTSGGGQTITFQNASVHDPSIIKVGAEYYVFGSHLAAARSTDLMNWTSVASGVNNANPLIPNVLTTLQSTFQWSTVESLWAPGIARLADGNYYLYYDSCRGDSPLSELGVVSGAAIGGPYGGPRRILRSGMNGLSEDGATVYDASVHPNVIDPEVFFDAQNRLWMVYGSYSGGIFILAMDEATGLPDAGQGYGTHLWGGNHARIEGPYILHNATTNYYYLFTSYGGLDAIGGYNIRVARSQNPNGPYFDGAGTDMNTVRASAPFNDPSIAPHGQKLLGNFQYALAAGESGTAEGYVSPGHNSAFFDAASGNYFLVFHSRFPGRGEQHEIRVHQLLFNSQGWPVIAPFRYVPQSLASPAIVADVANADVAGAYKLVDHGKDVSATIKSSQAIRLEANGTVTGAVTGTWIHRGANLVDVTIGGTLHHGVLSRQFNPNARRFTVTFTAQSTAGVSLWGVRTGD
jgi:arabinan endo-1,5-alpha-L-arabinosidase